MNHTAKIHGIT